jgi:hypothetical protein
MVEPLWMSPGWAAVVTSTDKSMPAAPADSGVVVIPTLMRRN